MTSKSPENPIRRVIQPSGVKPNPAATAGFLAMGMTSRPADPSRRLHTAPVISAPPAASRQPSKPAPSRVSGPSPRCAPHASSGPSECAPAPRPCVGQCWRRHASCTSRRPSLVPCKACPSWYGRHIAGRLEPRAGLLANRARAAWGFPATSKSSPYFGAIFFLMSRVFPDSLLEFHSLPEIDGLLTSLYLSGATITTLGYADIYPHTAVSRFTALLETFIGIIFALFIFAAFVSFHVNKITQDDS